MNWYLDALKQYAVFTGRARRKEYWFFVLFNIIIFIVLSLVDQALGLRGFVATLGLLSSLYWLAVIIPTIAVAVRRLHDIGRTGWWLLLAFIPVIGSVVLLVFALLDSQPGANQYGPNPKGVEAIPAA